MKQSKIYISITKERDPSITVIYQAMSLIVLYIVFILQCQVKTFKEHNKTIFYICPVSGQL